MTRGKYRVYCDEDGCNRSIAREMLYGSWVVDREKDIHKCGKCRREDNPSTWEKIKKIVFNRGGE